MVKLQEIMSEERKMYPSTHGVLGQFMEDNVLATLDPRQAEEWGTAVEQAEKDGTFYFAWTAHCAVGTKP